MNWIELTQVIEVDMSPELKTENSLLYDFATYHCQKGWERRELGLSGHTRKSLENNQLNSNHHTSWMLRTRQDLGDHQLLFLHSPHSLTSTLWNHFPNTHVAFWQVLLSGEPSIHRVEHKCSFPPSPTPHRSHYFNHFTPLSNGFQKHFGYIHVAKLFVIYNTN